MNISTSLLKSALQKSIRRNEPEKAVKCAKALIEQDAHQFLRRWVIIIIEDAVLHPKLDEVTELLKRIQKSGGEPLKQKEKDLLIQNVYEVADCKYTDLWMDTEYAETELAKDRKKWDEFAKENYSEIFKLPEKERELAQAIYYRSKIGGMQGDMMMLGMYSQLWMMRFINEPEEWNIGKLESYFNKSKLKYKDIGELKDEDILIEAIDFHCSPLLSVLMKKDSVINLLQKHYPDWPYPLEDLLKGIIWKQRSGITGKKRIGYDEVKQWYNKPSYFKNNDEQADTEIFQTLKNEIDSISRWWLKVQKEKKPKKLAPAFEKKKEEKKVNGTLF